MFALFAILAALALSADDRPQRAKPKPGRATGGATGGGSTGGGTSSTVDPEDLPAGVLMTRAAPGPPPAAVAPQAIRVTYQKQKIQRRWSLGYLFRDPLPAGTGAVAVALWIQIDKLKEHEVDWLGQRGPDREVNLCALWRFAGRVAPGATIPMVLERHPIGCEGVPHWIEARCRVDVLGRLFVEAIYPGQDGEGALRGNLYDIVVDVYPLPESAAQYLPA